MCIVKGVSCRGMSQGGRYYGNGKFLLRVFIAIYSVYYGYYGTFLKILLTLNQDTKNTLTFEKTLEKLSRFVTDITEYYGYYGNRYYEILWNIAVTLLKWP